RRPRRSRWLPCRGSRPGPPGCPAGPGPAVAAAVRRRPVAVAVLRPGTVIRRPARWPAGQLEASGPAPGYGHVVRMRHAAGLLLYERALEHILPQAADARGGGEAAAVQQGAEVGQHLRAAADHGAVVLG